MAREQRHDVDYFPHDCIHGRKMHIIETKYGNDGYATWFKLLEQLGKANFHYLDISDEMNLMFLVSVFKVDEKTALSILNDLSKLGAIDKFLYENHKIIYSQKFIESVKDAYRKRKSKILEYSDLLKQLGIKTSQTGGGLKEVGGIKAEVSRKEEKSKVKERKVDDEVKKTSEDVFVTIDLIIENYLKNERLVKAITGSQKISKKELENYLLEFQKHLESQGQFSKTDQDFKSHFSSWLKIQIKKSPKSNGTGKNTNFD
ncbi:Lin1244/Lin1753 domain-containing protein [Flavicella sediminum]|uniref:Lin1244/Lin1753 domain-containing protein n=1 Tax=Flavicella sediminum TaxID=2585141 RepID=UPI0011222F50|nr:Lin1244/Lin1753 domain-containing protein [Flavicella sediminum]